MPTPKKVRGATLAVAKGLPETYDVAGYEKLFAVDSFRDYGRFAGDGRTTVPIELFGYDIKRGAARKIIDIFLDYGYLHSASGLSAEVCRLWCEDTGTPSTVTWHEHGKSVARIDLRTPIKQGEK